jgi:hypothetical protein
MQGGRVGAFVQANRTTVIIGVVLVVLVFVAKIATGGPAATSVVSTLPTSSVVTDGNSSTLPAASVPALDTAGAQSALVLLSDRAGASAALGAEGSLNAAFWNGLAAVGASARVESVQVVGETADAVVLLADTATGAELGRVTVKLGVSNGAWRVIAWPAITTLLGN